MKYLAISAVLLVSTIAAQVVRADDDPYNRSGGYVGVGATRSFDSRLMENAFGDAFSPLDAHTSDSWGAHATAGYRFNKFIATEVEYEWMSGFHTRVGGVALANIETQTVTANLKIIAPYRAFQPYFLVGAGAMFPTVDKAFFNNMDVTNQAFTARFGAGLDYYLTQNLSLNIGTDVIVNTAKISSGTGGSGRGLDYLGAQFGFGYRF